MALGLFPRHHWRWRYQPVVILVSEDELAGRARHGRRDRRSTVARCRRGNRNGSANGVCTIAALHARRKFTAPPRGFEDVTLHATQLVERCFVRQRRGSASRGPARVRGAADFPLSGALAPVSPRIRDRSSDAMPSWNSTGNVRMTSLRQAECPKSFRSESEVHRARTAGLQASRGR